MACEESTSRRSSDDRRDRKTFFSQTIGVSIVLESFYYRKLVIFMYGETEIVLVGYIIAEHVLDQAELHRIAMIPFIRKMGIGTLLFHEFRRRYQEIGVDTIYLEVRESNEAAYQFYLKNGFEEYGRRAKYYKDPIEDAILMFCEISTDDQSFPLDSSETPVYNDERKEENEMKCNVMWTVIKQ